MTRARAGARHGGQGGQRGHRALAALGRPEAQARLAALEGLGAAVTEQAAAAAPRIAGIISDYEPTMHDARLPLPAASDSPDIPVGGAVVVALAESEAV